MFDALNTFLDKTSATQTENAGGLFTLSPTVENVLDKFYENLDRLGYNLTELKPALEQDGTSLIISCAGSGKTTFLELKLIRDFLAGELFEDRMVQTNQGIITRRVVAPVFISTFLKTGAEELKNSFDEKCTELRVSGICADNFTFSTLHAEYYSILKGLGIKMEIMPEDALSTALLDSCKSLGIRNRTKGTGGALTKDELGDVACIVTYARNRLDDKRYNHPLASDYGLTQPLLDKLIELFHKHRMAVNAYDFEDLQELVYNGIKTNPAFAQMVASRYRYVLIDEFQDTSQIQYEILKTYINGAKKTIAIGDDDQCIYSWRGSDVDIITTHFPQDYNPAIHMFTVNYRCKANILNPVISSIKVNSNRHAKQLSAFRPGGEVSVDKTCDVDSLMTEVKRSVAQGYSVGILSRTNFDLLAPAILLELGESIPFSISKSIGINSWIPRQVFGCIKLITRRFTEDFPDILQPFAGRYNRREVDALCEVLRNQPNVSIRSLDKADLAYSCPVLNRVLFKPMFESTDMKDFYIYMLKYLINQVYTGSSPYNIRARLFISFMIDLVANHSKLANLSIQDLDELFTDIIPARLSKRAYSKQSGTVPVRLTTVHEAKGKEWDSVILWNDTDGVFPAQTGNRTITADEMEEERRLHYIAFTRAKSRLTVYTSATIPSPFLLECDFSGQTTAPSPSSPITVSVQGSGTTQAPRDAFYDKLSEFMVSEDAKVNSDTMLVVSYYQYNIGEALKAIQDEYNSAKKETGINLFNALSFDEQMKLCIESLVDQISASLVDQTAESDT